MSDQTPIPAEALEAAAKVAFRHYESEYTAAPNMTWRDFVPEVRELVEAVAPILLAAGRTAAAADIRDHLTRRGRRVGAFPPITPDAALRDKAVIEAYETAARVAENGADGCPACGRLHFPWCAPYGGPQATGFQSGADR